MWLCLATILTLSSVNVNGFTVVRAGFALGRTYVHQSPDSERADSYVNPDVFGAEFNQPSWVSDEGTEYRDYKGRVTRTITPEKREKAMRGYDRLRLAFIVDSIFVSLLGLCGVWYFGTYQDATSYIIGAALGIAYSILLSKFVEGIGNETRRTSQLGGLRFAPALLLVLLYAKNKGAISFIPEFVGFFTFQLGSLLQAFNTDPYGDGVED